MPKKMKDIMLNESDNNKSDDDNVFIDDDEK